MTTIEYFYKTTKSISNLKNLFIINILHWYASGLEPIRIRLRKASIYVWFEHQLFTLNVIVLSYDSSR